MSAISNLVPVCEARGIFFDIKMAYTGPMIDDSMYEDTVNNSNGTPDASVHALDLSTNTTKLDESTVSDRSVSTRSILSRSKSVRTQPNRFDLYGEIEKKSTVFCQGSAGLKNAVEAVCKILGARYFGGRGGAREDLS